jgi:subtilisin family serine protease
MTTLDFDQLLDARRLWAALADATGRGVCVAILDTGVDVTHPDLQGAVVRSVEVFGPPQPRVSDLPATGLSAQQLDPVGHGTACAGIIHQISPQAQLISVRVIGAGAAGTGEQFVRGLQWVLTQCQPKVQVVNLSLGTMEERFAGPLRRLVDQAYANDVMLVAAANNMGHASYPAQFASLISVDNQGFPDPLTFHYQRGRPIEVVARGIYVQAPKSGGGYQLWTGTSFACPHISGVVARLLSLNPRLTTFQVKTLLHVLRANRPVETESKPTV